MSLSDLDFTARSHVTSNDSTVQGLVSLVGSLSAYSRQGGESLVCQAFSSISVTAQGTTVLVTDGQAHRNFLQCGGLDAPFGAGPLGSKYENIHFQVANGD